MPAAEPPRQSPNFGAIWALLWRATILLFLIAAVIVFALEGEWPWCGAALLSYISVRLTISRFSPGRHDPPRAESGQGILL
jgi:hypothetical protein